MESRHDVNSGDSFPLGATVCAEGANIAVCSKTATHVELLFFDSADAGRPTRVIPLNRQRHRTRSLEILVLSDTAGKESAPRETTAAEMAS